MTEANEKLSEMMEEQHHKGGGEDHDPGWIKKVSMSMAVISVITAVSNMMEGHTGNEAIYYQIKASDQWAYYQAKGIKAEVTTLKGDKYAAKYEKYKHEQETISEKAKELENESVQQFQKHRGYSLAVVTLEIAITLGAVAALTHNPMLW